MQMAPLDPLDSPVQLSTISLETKCAILDRLWGMKVQPSEFYKSDLHFDLYFRYYSQRCEAALYDGGRHVSVRIHRNIIDIAEDIKADLDRKAIKSNLSLKLSWPKPANEDEVLDASIDLVASLLLMMNFRDAKFGYTGRRPLEWTTNTLKEFMTDMFKNSKNLGKETVKLEKIFSAVNFGRIAGIEIEWTNNLADHLRLIDEDKKVVIFHHASFLDSQTSWYESHSRYQIDTQADFC